MMASLFIGIPILNRADLLNDCLARISSFHFEELL